MSTATSRWRRRSALVLTLICMVAIILAAYYGQAPSIARLVAGGADPDRQSTRGRTALAEAVGAGKLASVEALIAGGADVNLKPRKQHLPLYTAIHKKRVAIAIALLKGGARATSMIRARAKSTVFGKEFKGADGGRIPELRGLLERAPAL